MWKGVEVMKFKVGDEVVFKNDAYGIASFVEEIWSKNKKSQKYKYYVKDDWYEEDDLELVTDPLVTKIEERNNKPVKMISGENLLNENDPIKPSHYRKGEIDLYESWYRTYPFNEFRAGMQMIAERYMKRDKHARVEDINKSIETLTRLKEYEELEKSKKVLSEFN